MTVHHPHVAVLIVRVVFGLFMAAHGFNKVFGGSGLTGTAGWFGSIGFKWPKWQARAAAVTEIGGGLLFAAGLFTPVAAAAMVALMVVAIWTAHRSNGFFVFKPGQGWEYCASIAVVAAAIGIVGGGRLSLDRALHIHFSAGACLIVTLGLGIGGAVLHLAASFRPSKG